MTQTNEAEEELKKIEELISSHEYQNHGVNCNDDCQDCVNSCYCKDCRGLSMKRTDILLGLRCGREEMVSIQITPFISDTGKLTEKVVKRIITKPKSEEGGKE